MDNLNNFTGANLDDSDRNNKDIEGSVWTPEIITRVSTVFTVMIFTLIGNILLITLIIHKRSRRIKRVNIFIVNLAIGDLAIACITMTTEILFVAFGEWVLGPFMCKLSVYLQVVTLASSTFLLTGMSVDRYQVIVRPMQSLASRPTIWKKVCVAWIMAFCFALPQLFIFVHVEQKVSNSTQLKRMCLSKGYSAPWQRKLYFSFLTLYTLLIPAIIMSYCYYKIAQVVWSRVGSQKSSINSTSYPRELSIQRSLISRPKQRVVTMTLTVIIGFLSTLTPYYTVSLIRIYSNYSIQLKTALDVSEIILMMHSAINPVLYGIFTLRLQHVRSFCCKSSERTRLRDDIRTSKSDVNGCIRLKCQIKFVKRRNRYYDTTTIIANHVIKEERENIARSARSCRDNKRNYNEMKGLRINKSEKSVQVNESVFFRNTVFVDESVENCSSV